RSLNFCIAEVRAALGDDARSPRFVETLPRRGYRFIADVRRGAPPDQSDQPHEDSPISADTDASGQPIAWLLSTRPSAWAAVVPRVVAAQPVRTAAHTRATALPAARSAFERALKSSEEGTDGQRRGIAALRAATRIDPRFAEAHYALADLYLDLAAKRE